MEVDDAAARTELAKSLDLALSFVAQFDETRQERLARKCRTDLQAQAHALEILA